MPAASSDRASAPRLALFWFGIQAVWGALLGISLQARSAELAGTGAIALYSLLAIAGSLVAAAVQIAAGAWSDAIVRGGGRRVAFYVCGTAVAAVGLAYFYRAQNVPGLLASIVVLQAGMNVAIGAYQAIVPDTVEPSRYGAASAWMAALQSAGNAAGAALAALVNDGRVVAAALTATLVVTCGATALHARNFCPRSAAPAGGSLVTRAFLDLFVSRALIYTGFYTLLGYLYFYVEALGVTTTLSVKTQSGLTILAFTIAGALGAAIAARPTDRFDKRAVASAGGGIVAVALLGFVAARGPGPAAAAAVAAGTGWGVFLVADWALACRVLPSGALATTMAIWNLAVVGPQVAAPILAGAVLLRLGGAGRHNGPRVAFCLAAAEIVLGILWVWRLPKAVSVENSQR